MIELDAALILQGFMVVILGGVGHTVYKSSVNLARLEERLTAHEKADALLHSVLLKKT